MCLILLHTAIKKKGGNRTNQTLNVMTQKEKAQDYGNSRI